MARTPGIAPPAFVKCELAMCLDVLLGAWAKPAIDALAEDAEALDAAEPDTDGLALLGETLRLPWRRHGLNDPTAEIPDELRERYEAAMRRADDAVGD
jgi:hypothetical protein